MKYEYIYWYNFLLQRLVNYVIQKGMVRLCINFLDIAGTDTEEIVTCIVEGSKFGD